MVGLGAGDVVGRIADHDGLSDVSFFRQKTERLSDDGGFVVFAGAVLELIFDAAAAEDFKVSGESKVVGDAAHGAFGLAGGNRQTAAVSFERLQKFRDAGVGMGFVEADSFVTLAEAGNGEGDVFGAHVVGGSELDIEGRADEMGEVRRFFVNAEGGEGRLHGFGDAFFGGGKGAVEVKEDGVVFHVSLFPRHGALRRQM